MKDGYEKYGPDWRKFLMKHSMPNLVELFKPQPDSYKTKDELINHVRATLIVKDFNEKHNVGTVVFWRNSRVQVGRPMTVQTPAYVNNNIPVVFFQEKNGYCSIEPQFLEG
jgi:hypothetical protein